MTGSIYRQFALARTVFYALAACLFLMLPTLAGAQPNAAYTIEGVEVDVTAKNAVEAREKALMEAQGKAYQMLADRLLNPEELTTFQVPDANTLSNLVQDFEVTNEQLSAVRYKGTYTIRFRPNAMKSQMAAQGKTYSDVQKKPLLILPFYEVGDKILLWSDMNPWMKAWRNLPGDRNAIQPTVLPLGDARDMAELSDDHALDYDPVRMQDLAERYDADDVAILVASEGPSEKSENDLVVNVYSHGFEGPVFARKVIVSQSGAEERDAFFARAAMKVKGLLRGNWKEDAAYPSMPYPMEAARNVMEQVPDAQPGGYEQIPQPMPQPAAGPSTWYIAYARFASVQEWVRMKSILDHLYGVQGVMIKSLKSREALLDIRFAGNMHALQQALQTAGVIMRATPDGGIELYMMPAQATYGQ